MSTIVKTHDPNTGFRANLYSHLATVEGSAKLIYTAGQVGRDKAGNVPESYEEQAKLAYENLGHCLAAVNASPKDIVKLTYYIVNYDPNRRLHVKYTEEFLGGHRPPITSIPVQQLAAPEFLFEVEAVAAVRLPNGGNNSNHLTEHTRGKIEADVIVVGGGISGLQAALNVQKAGLSSIVLEARHRVGGKLFAVPIPRPGEEAKEESQPSVDLGGAWINDSNQRRAYALAKTLDLELIEQATDGDCLVQRSDGAVTRFKYGEIPKISSEYQNEAQKTMDIVENLCHSVQGQALQDYDNMSMEEFISAHNLGRVALEYVTLWTRAMLGCEPSDMSALYFLDYCKLGGGLKQMRSDRKNGGQFLRARLGVGSLATGLASMLKPGTVIANSPVSRIVQDASGQKVEVITHSGIRYRCRKVIFSLPTPLYREVDFEPPLPAQKVQFSSSTKLGYYAKMILIYDKPWWREHGLCGLTQSFLGPASLTRDTSSTEADGQYSLTCFIVGEPGREWSKLAKSQRRSKILEQLSSIYGPELAQQAKNPVIIFEQDWEQEQFSRGCPCPVTPPGVLSNLPNGVLQAPFGNVHFVGTETGRQWKGYIEGALESAERGAEEVNRLIGRTTSFSRLSAKL